MIDKRPMPHPGVPANDLITRAVSEVEAVLSVLRRPGGPSDQSPLDEKEERYQRVGAPRVGGFGLVWEAYDQRTERRVAVKEPRPDRPGAVAVLAHEAVVLARLQHPNVIPLFDLVPSDPTGWPPVYVMPFLGGPTLREHAAAFHAARPAVAREALLPLLRPFLDVCRAVQYAHDRGWLHLDIKGSNVKLGPTGEAVLLDWGLAREQGAAPPAGAAGTPTHMAPEQAAAVGVDRQTDVYGLGALLYELLTGRPPFDPKGDTSGLDYRADGRLPAPPHAHWPAVPPPLEAVCLKALAGRPADRYLSADAVRAEVERWLARDRVEAYPEPWAERLTRVLVRYRGPVAAAAVGLVLSLAATVAGLVQVSAARSDAEARRQEATEALAREQAGLRDALRSGDRLFAAFDPRLYSDFDPHVPHRDFLAAEAIRHYEQLIARHRDNTAVAHEVVNARLRLGRLLRILGQVAPAEVELRAALLTLESHLLEDRSTAELFRAEAETTLGRVCYETGRWDEGDARLEGAIRTLARRAGQGRDVRAAYATALSHRAWGLWVRGRPAEALQDSELCGQLIATDPGPGRVVWAAISRCMTGHLRRDLGRPAEAERLFAGIQDDLRPLLDDPFNRFEARRWLATAQNGRGMALRDLRREPEATDEFRAAYCSRKETLAASPADRRLAQEVAASALNLAALLSRGGGHDEAVRLAGEAVELLETRHREAPDQVVLRQQLQAAHRRAVDIAAAAGRPADAVRHRERAAELDPPKK